MSVLRDFTKDFIKCRWRTWVGATVVDTGTASRYSTSLDKDLTKLRKGLEEDIGVDLQGEEELELVEGGLVRGLSEGHDELVLGAGLWWDWGEGGVMVMAVEGVCEGGSDSEVDETFNTAAPEDGSSAIASNSSSSLASKQPSELRVSTPIDPSCPVLEPYSSSSSSSSSFPRAEKWMVMVSRECER